MELSMKSLFLILLMTSAAFAQEVNFGRSRGKIERGHHKLLISSADCAVGSSICKGLDREGKVRMEIAPRKKNSARYALYIYDTLGKIVTVFEDDSQLMAFGHQLNDLHQDSKCKISLILNQNNEIESSISKCR
jgi:hypothetical protein